MPGVEGWRNLWPAISALLWLGCSSVPLFSGTVDRYERACEGGDLRACDYLGGLFTDGDRVEADPDRALAYFELACDGG